MTITRRGSWRVALGLCAAWAVGSSCDGGTGRDTVVTQDTGVVPGPTPGPTPSPTPIPQSSACPQGRAPMTPVQLKACVDGLRFDPDTLVGDEQPLTEIGTTTGLPCPGDPGRRCRYGPMARIEPVVNAQNYTEEELRQGRIIARISVPGGEKVRYRKYGLRPGRVTYWWVRTDATRTAGESLFLTETGDGNVVVVKRKLKRELYLPKGYETARALARWIWTLDDETAKARCGQGSCS
jgi:hypothetical protein